MAEKHFKQLGLASFSGSPIYEPVVPPDHFLVQLGLLRYGLQAHLTALVLNLKRRVVP